MRKIKGLRWYMIALVTLGTVLGYLTRNTVAAAAPTLMEELHISTQQYSYIIAAYSAAYTIMQPVAGYVLDILGTKIGYAFFAIAWAVFCALAAAGAVGAGARCGRCGRSRDDPGRPEGQLRVVPGKRAFYCRRLLQRGFFYWRDDCAAAGGVGYRHAQLADGVHYLRRTELRLGNGVAGFLQTPARSEKLSEEERDYIIGGQEAQHQTNNGKKCRLADPGTRQFWGIALPRFLAEPAWGTFNAWIPLFMFKVYGFNLKEIAMFAWMPMLFADLGCIVGGYLPPLFQRWFGVNLIVSRKMVVTMGALLMIGPGMIGLFTSPYVAIALLCIGGFAHQSLSGALITLSSDVFGRNEVATANGLTGMAAWTASTMFALVVGALADTIGFQPAVRGTGGLRPAGRGGYLDGAENKSADDDAPPLKTLSR
jgi:ACS family hexuronate transporter-like MFS transporter